MTKSTINPGSRNAVPLDGPKYDGASFQVSAPGVKGSPESTARQYNGSKVDRNTSRKGNIKKVVLVGGFALATGLVIFDHVNGIRDEHYKNIEIETAAIEGIDGIGPPVAIFEGSNYRRSPPHVEGVEDIDTAKIKGQVPFGKAWTAGETLVDRDNPGWIAIVTPNANLEELGPADVAWFNLSELAGQTDEDGNPYAIILSSGEETGTNTPVSLPPDVELGSLEPLTGIGLANTDSFSSGIVRRILNSTGQS